MHEIDRRSTLMLGFATAGAVLLAEAAAAQPYKTDEGRELMPGARVVKVSERASMPGRESVLPAYKRIVVRDVVYETGVTHKSESMMNDMI